MFWGQKCHLRAAVVHVSTVQPSIKIFDVSPAIKNHFQDERGSAFFKFGYDLACRALRLCVRSGVKIIKNTLFEAKPFS